ncbi:MAG: hypothetical protein ABJA86_05510 [Nocardioidaceae bacterium]
MTTSPQEPMQDPDVQPPPEPDLPGPRDDPDVQPVDPDVSPQPQEPTD